MNQSSFLKKINEIQKNTENLFSAAKFEEYNNFGYNSAIDWVRTENKEIPALSEQVINDGLTCNGWYEELIHARLANGAFESSYPEMHKHMISLIARLIFLDGCIALDDSYDVQDPSSFAVEFTQLIRSQILMRNWAKYRKAYIFDKELAHALMDMDKDIDIPLEMPLSLPYNTMYFELPDFAPLNSYAGVYVSVNKSYGIKSITSKNVAVLEKMVKENEAKALTYKNKDEYTKMSKWLNTQKDYNKRDNDLAMSEDYISLHFLFIGNNKDYLGFNETFTYVCALSADKDNICHLKKGYVREKIGRDDFDDPDNLTDIVMFLLNAMMYLGAINSDIETKKIAGAKKLIPFEKNKKRKIKWENTDVELNKCGFMYGASMRAYKEREQDISDNERLTDSKGHPVRPHPVRGHFQRYHKGKGRIKIEWIFKAPHFNKGSFGSEPLVNVSKIVGNDKEK